MKTPRHEQPWYEARLENNKKPSKITEEERTILTEENRKLIEDAPRIISWGVANGWIAYPIKEQRKWKMQELGTSTEATQQSSSNSSDALSTVWPNSELQ